MLSKFLVFPLLAFSVIVFGVLTLAGMGGGEGLEWYQQTAVVLSLVNDEWTVTFGDVYIMVSMGLLFVELLRSTQTGTDSILNHAFSVVVFVIALLLFVIVEGFGNSVFFLVVIMTFLDFMAGFIVTTVTARRDFGVTESIAR